MKIIIIILVTILFSTQVNAQDILGSWIGTMSVQGNNMRVGFNFSMENGINKSSMDSPDQNTFGIPAETISLISSNIEISIPNIKVIYKGQLNEKGIIEGSFKQGGMSFALNLSPTKNNKSKNLRLQKPNKPYPYHSENIKFTNEKDQISLSGTFTKPTNRKNFTTVILISGSGPQNRDEEIMGHKPFFVLSDYLTRQGYGVLRYDDRGCFESEGNFKASTTKDFATDVESAVNYLKSRKDINRDKIGLIGHSEGGLIAPMVAQNNSDIAFIILMAGTGVEGRTILLDQQYEINKIEGLSELENNKAMTFSTDVFNFMEANIHQINKKDLANYIEKKLNTKNGFEIPETLTKEDFIAKQVEQLSSPWINYFLFYNPEKALQNIKCPVLAINGTKDIQVKSSLNLPAIDKALEQKRHKLTQIIELEGLNHLFQECETGAVSEYKDIKETISPKALKIISDWMNTLN